MPSKSREPRGRSRRSKGPSKADMERRTANLEGCRRLDAAVAEIEVTFAHAVLYAYDVSAKRWDKRDMEGPVLIARRDGTNVRRLFILNRLSRKNFALDLSPSAEVEVQSPYLLLRDRVLDASAVHGLWMPESSELESLSREISTAISKSKGPVAEPKGGGEDAGAALLRAIGGGGSQKPPSEAPYDREAFRRAMISLLSKDDSLVDSIFREYSKFRG